MINDELSKYKKRKIIIPSKKSLRLGFKSNLSSYKPIKKSGTAKII